MREAWHNAEIWISDRTGRALYLKTGQVLYLNTGRALYPKTAGAGALSEDRAGALSTEPVREHMESRVIYWVFVVSLPSTIVIHLSQVTMTSTALILAVCRAPVTYE